MELLTEELRRGLPALYTQEGNQDPIVHIKFFTPDSNWTWYATEGSAEGDDFIFFGYVIGFEREWGYFHPSSRNRSVLWACPSSGIFTSNPAPSVKWFR